MCAAAWGCGCQEKEGDREGGDQKKWDRSERFQPRSEMNARSPAALEPSWAPAVFHPSRTFPGSLLAPRAIPQLPVLQPASVEIRGATPPAVSEAEEQGGRGAAACVSRGEERPPEDGRWFHPGASSAARGQRLWVGVPGPWGAVCSITGIVCSLASPRGHGWVFPGRW